MVLVSQNSIAGMAKGGLCDASGQSYNDFRRSLAPYYVRLWAQIAAAYLVLVSTLLMLVLGNGVPVAVQIPMVVGGGLIIGYSVAFIGLFIHEAVHYNVAADRIRNDRLANIFIGMLVGMDVKRYRRVHLQHHKLLGTPQDPERSYFSALNLRFVIEALTGIRVLRVLFSYQKQLNSLPTNKQNAGLVSPTLCGALVLHASLLAAGLILGYWAAAIAWVGGVAVVFPFLASLRQLLEHRSTAARRTVDFSQVAHGQTNRLFGDGPLASTLGGAGFNRHLLHHWDPGISCTRLPDVERYLLDTQAAGTIHAHQTSYWRAFKSLYAR